MEFNQVVFHWTDCSCQPSSVGKNMVYFVLLDLFQVMHLANMEIDSKFLRWFTKTVGKWLRKTLGTWLRKVGVSSNCARCHLQAETQKHCLWDCIESQLVWQHLLRLFVNYFPPSVFTWHMVGWMSLVHSIFNYGVNMWTKVITPNQDVFMHFH